MIKLSVCMMVKNEERNLRRCLESVKSIADELIVVDTGSTDATVAIAEEFGAKVYHSPWRHDFSFHRNESISFATGDWVLIIDADEQFIIEDGHDLRAQLGAIGETCHATRMWVEDVQGGRMAMSHQTNRIFRRASIRYNGRKHNKPAFPGDTVTQLIGFKIYHYGYDTDQIAGKKERDLELLHKMREEEPDNAQVLFYLSQVYGYYVNDYPRALNYIWQYLKAARGAPDFQPAAYTSGAEIARHAQDMDAAARLIAEGLAAYPDDIDLNYLAARNAAVAGRADEIERPAQAYLIAFDRLSNSPHAHDSRFLFFFDADSLCVILQLATVNHLYRGYSALAKFREYLPKTSEASRDELAGCMTTDLDRIGERFGLRLEV